jgi:coenzyme F420-reducing hydrogenase beta subunit
MKDHYSPEDIVKSGLCIGCGCCSAINIIAGKTGKMSFDGFGQLKPDSAASWYYEKSEGFSRICPFSPEAENEDQISERCFSSVNSISLMLGRYISNKTGFVNEDDYRLNGSSGGMVTWLETELFRKGLVDGIVHVVPVHPEAEGSFFKYRISRNEREIKEGSKSRYYPVELSGALKEIHDRPGHYAIVAVPCMIKAINLLRMNNKVFMERIRFTLGIFCGHMKSAKFAESFAWQMNVQFRDVEQIDYRRKIADRPANWYNAVLTLKNRTRYDKDWWHMRDGDWGAGFFMNSACNFCDDVVAETADISFGDAWVEPYSSDGKGTNIVIIRSETINEIISSGISDNRLHLEGVTAELAERTQAAGFRQRREGLAYRLTWATKVIIPPKRVKPDTQSILNSRKRIYRMRYYISKWSHRLFRIASIMKMHWIYLWWARIVASVYYSMAYHNGSFSQMRRRYIRFGK